MFTDNTASHLALNHVVLSECIATLQGFDQFNLSNISKYGIMRNDVWKQHYHVTDIEENQLIFTLITNNKFS